MRLVGLLSLISASSEHVHLLNSLIISDDLDLDVLLRLVGLLLLLMWQLRFN